MNINFGLGSRRRLATMPTTQVSATQPTNTSAVSVATERRSSPDDDWETPDLSSTEYARRSRELMQLINDLKSMGAETLIDLPSIVVIGGQSAGKSSLVEAVSGVNVPRDGGTCTRCPMEVTMSSSTTWSCTIKLRFDYDSSGRSEGIQQKEIAFGPTITNRDEVDVWLRRAQAAILNPELAPESFHKKTIQELRSSTPTNSLKFSRNVVSIFIDDPNATDLCFVDLPGLIQNEDQEVVDLVRELTEFHIRRQNTIILTTIPMSDEMENQQSVKLARDADPEGERIIGILTKPDTLGEGAVDARKRWLDVIEGRQHKLKHGYYCVRLPDDAQRAQRLTRPALQRMAENFFNATPPWSEVVDCSRFGIPAFVSDVSVLLVNHISKVIPQLKEDVERLLTACMAEIGTLPEPLKTNPQVEVLLRVNAFCDAFKGIVYGTNSDKSLAQQNRALYTIFDQGIRGTAPDFRPFEQALRFSPFTALESEEHPTYRDKRVRTMGVYDIRKVISESTAWELPGNIPYEAKIRLINQFTILWSIPAEKCLASINDVLDDVIQTLVRTHFGRFKVLRDLILDLIRPDIEQHRGRALVAIKETLGLEITPNYTQNVIDYHDLRRKWYAKYRRARQHPGDHKISEPEFLNDVSLAPTSPDGFGGVDSVDSPKKRGKEKKEPPCEKNFFPLRSNPVRVANQQYTANLTCDGFDSRPKTVSHAEEQALEYLAQAGYKGLTVDDLARLCPPDMFEDELNVMADVRAYFTIACKRIIDHVPLKIEQILYQSLAEGMSANLLQRLMVDTSPTGNFADRMKELVREDPDVETKRTKLEAKCTRLQEMKRRLANFVA